MSDNAIDRLSTLTGKFPGLIINHEVCLYSFTSYLITDVMNDIPADDNADPLPHLASDLRVVIGKLRRRLRDEAQPGEYSWSQISILGRLDRDGPTTVSSLARSEGMRPQSMGAIVATLQTAGLVAGVPHPTDGRQILLTITDACRALVQTSRAAREDWLSRAIQSNLDREEQQALTRSVELLKRLVDS